MSKPNQEYWEQEFRKTTDEMYLKLKDIYGDTSSENILNCNKEIMALSRKLNQIAYNLRNYETPIHKK